METGSVEVIVRSLNEQQVQYLVVGGLAVVAHGYVRFTADVDLVLSVDEPNLRRAVIALQSLDYRPRAPVPFAEFLQPESRRKWAIEKGMMVFSLFSPKHPMTEVDLFLEPPLDFVAAYANALKQEIAPGITATFASWDDLIHLKTLADRPRDREDIAKLRALRNEKKI